MALAFVRWLLSVTILDSAANKSVLKYDVVGVDYAAALTAAQAIITDLTAVTAGKIEGWGLTTVYEDDAFTLPGSECNVENVALITAQIDTDDPVELKWTNLKIPAPVIGIFKAATGPESNVVDTADSGILAYLENFEDGGNALVSDGEALKDVQTAGNWYGKRIHRASRKG